MQWMETYPSDLEDRPVVAISDGYTTFCAMTADLDEAISSYVKTCGFNEPGDVSCIAKLYKPGDYDLPSETRRFVIRSDNGNTGYLV